MESITKQLVNIGHGMSKEIAADEPAVAKLLVELSSALDVQYERGNALEARCAALAAENAGLKQSELEYDATCREEFGSDWVTELTETPATDAFLAEVRAQGLNAFIQHHSAELDAHIKNGGEQFDEKSVRIRDIIVSARLFREQIRKGVQS